MKLVFTLLLAVTLSGCAGGFFNDYGKYQDTLSTHSVAESERIIAQSSAIASAAKIDGATKTEQVLLSAIAMMNIERLRFTPLPIKAPVTGFTVLNSVVQHIPFAVSTIGMTRLGEAAIEAAGSTIMTADTITNTDSLNKSEVSAFGRDTSAASSANRDYSTSTDDTLAE